MKDDRGDGGEEGVASRPRGALVAETTRRAEASEELKLE